MSSSSVRFIKSQPYSVFFTFVLLLSGSRAFSQALTSSPYSRYGIGELQQSGFVQNFSMGGMGIALQNDSTTPYFINHLNPASYPVLKLTAFEVGALSNTVKLSSSSTERLTNNTSLAYVAFAFPFSKWWGSSVGLMPYSNVGYQISDEQTMTGVGPVKYLYNGEGGINRFYFGNAFRPFYRSARLSGLSVGFNASYLFGKLDNARRVIFMDTVLAFNTKMSRTTTIGDLYLDYGIQYGFRIDSLGRRELKEPVKINFGLTAATQSAVHAKSDILSVSYFVRNGIEIPKDTIEYTTNGKGNITFPLFLGGGMTFKKGSRWLVGADYAIQQWSDFAFFDKTSELKNSMRASLGMQYSPGAKKTDAEFSYLRKVYYRCGLRYYKTYLELKETPLEEYAFSIGLGLPVGRRNQFQFAMINIGLEAGQRGTTARGLIQEKFLRAVLGVTLNDKWFIKSKFD